MTAPKTVLITGAGSGFGALSARALLTAGHRVFATMREPEKRNRPAAAELAAAAESGSGSLHVLELDVTSDPSVERAVAAALEREGRVDAVINNAGFGMSGFAEAFTADEMRRLFEVNLFGVQRVNRAVLPSMRAAGSGLLIHVSSTFGRHVVPFVAPYTATKWALEALAESYRHELAGTGVEVVIVEPGAFETGHAERILGPEDEERQADYGERGEVPLRMWGSFVDRMQAASPDPQLVADKMVELVEAPDGARPARVVIDPVTGGEVTRGLNTAGEEARGRFYRALGIFDVLDRG
jgi:NAD(P)-dependent dehydrogenase (short-subunit alcohol dehydrogenase family)